MHVGSALTALVSHALGSHRVLRIEDLDPARALPGAVEGQLADLAWLGLRYDEAPASSVPDAHFQSQRSAHYERALSHLAERGLLYPCDCSRAELQRIASAPHAGEELRYPGLCRDKDPRRAMRRPPALRVRVGDAEEAFVDALSGAPCRERLADTVGDFVLQRGDGVYSYQLAVVVDDCLMHIDHVVRGRDLLGSTARQLWLAKQLGLTPPRFWLHLPLVVLPSGARLAKRDRGLTLARLRAHGVKANEVVGLLGHAIGLLDDPAPQPADALQLTPEQAPRRLRREPLVLPAPWLELAETA